MNRGEKRRQEWLDKKVASNRIHPKEINPEKLRFIEDVAGGKQVFKAEGILGEASGNNAWVDEIIKPETGGTFLKLYGISYKFAGAVPKSGVNTLELPKFALFTLTKESYLFGAYLAYLFFFAKKRLYWLLWEVDHRTLRHIDIPASEYCKTSEAFKKAFFKALKEVFGIDLSRPHYPTDHPRFRPERRYPDGKDALTNILGWIVALICKFLSVFLELDTAYRLRVQDGFSQLGRRTITEFYRILDLMISRETERGIPHKWKFIKFATKALFFVEPKLKEFAESVLRNLDVDEIKLTEDDWYFCLGYVSYNFGGVEREKRVEIRKRLDKEKGHVFFFDENIVY